MSSESMFITEPISEKSQLVLDGFAAPRAVNFRTQLLKWIGNKQSQAEAIISHFPSEFDTYYEPFLGSGGVLGVLAPNKAVASDVFLPLVQIWQTLNNNKELLKQHYAERYQMIGQLGKKRAYETLLARYNASPNGADLLFLCRACYGGVVRFRKADGYMSTPVGAHNPVTPESFAKRVQRKTIWPHFLNLNGAVLDN